MYSISEREFIECPIIPSYSQICPLTLYYVLHDRDGVKEVDMLSLIITDGVFLDTADLFNRTFFTNITRVFFVMYSQR